MSTMFWNVLRVSPALLGASLLVASSSYAAQSAADPTSASVESAPQLSEALSKKSTVAAIANEQAIAVVEPTAEPQVQFSQVPVETPQVAQLPVEGTTPSDPTNTLRQINRYNDSVSGTSSDALDQITNVSQLRDVSPGDWAYEALRSLVERYGCIVGYPDGTFRGNRATTRYEFAAGLNACLQQIERLVTGQEGGVTREDFETLQRLVQEFEAELATLGTRVDNLEGRVAFLEDHQFSTTTKLNGEVIFAFADTFGGDEVTDARGNTLELDDNTVFFDRVRLNLDTSFTGKDRLRTRLQAGNYQNFELQSVTNEGRLGFTASSDPGNDVFVEKLWYRAPLGDIATVHLFANAGNYDDFVPLLNPAMESSGTGSISRFGRYSPIYRIGGQSSGVGFTFGPKSPIRVDVGYLAGNGNDPGEDAGIFNGNYSALAQVTFQPSPALGIAATYVHAYDTNPGGAVGGNLRHGTGSIASQISTNRPVVANAYGLEASFAFSPSIILSGWAAYTDAIVLGRGGADVWTYGATLALRDLGSEGSVLGLVVGVEPKLTGSDRTVGALLPGGRREDPDTGLHIEGFYKFQVNDNISITPGVVWLTAPGHNDDNDDVVVGVVRTTFSF